MSLKPDYQNRKQEVQSHLDFIKEVESFTIKSQLKSVTILQQNILKASFFIHLYGLIESTLALCILEVENKINNHHISDFSTFRICIQKLWIKHYFQLNNANNKLEKRIDITHKAYTNALDTNSLFELKIKEKLRTVDNNTFDAVAKILDLRLNIPKNIRDIIINNNRYDGKNTLELIRTKRDKLAHGELSYSDVGNYTYADLKSLFNEVCTYLDYVVEAFEKYISEEGYKLKEDVSEEEQ
ncbi:MAG: hypothetical protein IKW80_00315 [Thermoguttaceae bacterium]|nr:hypothetical protein [Thermoguttaceae bacterium]